MELDRSIERKVAGCLCDFFSHLALTECISLSCGKCFSSHLIFCLWDCELISFRICFALRCFAFFFLFFSFFFFLFFFFFHFVCFNIFFLPRFLAVRLIAVFGSHIVRSHGRYEIPGAYRKLLTNNDCSTFIFVGQRKSSQNMPIPPKVKYIDVAEKSM